MDAQQFDKLTRALANGRSRRSLIKGFAGMFATAAGLAGADEALANPGPKKCKYEESSCKFDENCCSGTCCNRTCCADGQSCCGGRCYDPCPDGQNRNSACTCAPTEPEPECRADGDCPPATSPCQTAVCTDGECGVANTTGPCGDGGTCVGGVCEESQCSATRPCPPPTEYCVTVACVEGTCVESPFVCDDGNPCTNDICQPDGTCIFEPHPAGGNCPGGVCDGSGACIAGCQSAAECPIPSQYHPDCVDAVCAAGTCSFVENGFHHCDSYSPDLPLYCVGGVCEFQSCSAAVPNGDCDQGQTCCGGICRNIWSDPSNCGGCGHSCPGSGCENGRCCSGGGGSCDGNLDCCGNMVCFLGFCIDS
jgi:hypothetical protein